MKEEYVDQEERLEEDITLHFAKLLADIWKGCRRFYRILAVLIAAGASLCCLLHTIFCRPMYEAYASFLIITKNESSSNEAEAAYSFSYNRSTADQLSSTFPYILNSDILQDSLREVLGTDKINGKILAETVEDSNLVTLRVISDRSADAGRILETVLAVLPTVTQYVIGPAQFQMLEESNSDEPMDTLSRAESTLIGAAGGLGLGALFLIGYALTRRTIRDAEEIKALWSVPYLGALPKVYRERGRNRQDGADWLDKNGIGEAFEESIRSLQAKIEHAMKQEGQQILLITSTDPNEGKTTVSCHLARAMAQGGKRVILVDGDLRTAALKERLNAEGKSLTDVILGKAARKEAIGSVPGEEFLFLGNSKAISNPSSLIVSPEMKQLMQSLKAEADYVIVDTPAAAPLSDAVYFWNCADAVLYVIRQDQTEGSRILKAASEFPDNGNKMIGCILNGAEVGIAGYGYGYGYGYGCGYGYRYGDGHHKKGSRR